MNAADIKLSEIDMKFTSLLLMASLLTACATAPTYRVGPTRQFKKVSDVVGKLKPGDVVEVDPGVYREAMKVKANGTTTQPITIRGAAGRPRPVFDADGVSVSGKGPVPRAIFQIEGSYVVLERLELKNARNGSVGAGVRVNGGTTFVKAATVRDCDIHDNDNGIVSNDVGLLTVENCEVHHNGTAEWKGYAHNFYTHGNFLIVRNCYIHDSRWGQNFKTRAHYNELWFNWIADSDEGEVGPVDERERVKINTGLPNSNVVAVGNVIVSKPSRDGNPSKFILFGAELKPEETAGHNGTLYLFHNTLIAGSDKIVFIQLADAKAKLVAANNIFYGSDRIFGALKPHAGIEGRNNLIPPTATAPDGWTGTIKADPKFVNAARRDFQLAWGSPAIDAGADVLRYVDGNGNEQVLVGPDPKSIGMSVGSRPAWYVNGVNRSPWPGMKAVPRLGPGKPDVGAYESAVGYVTTRPE